MANGDETRYTCGALLVTVAAVGHLPTAVAAAAQTQGGRQKCYL